MTNFSKSCLAIWILALSFFGCTPQTAGNKTSDQNLHASESAMTTEIESLDKNIKAKVGISRPKPQDGVINHDRRQSLQVSFWVVAEAKPNIALIVNSKPYELSVVERRDVDEKFPDYEFRSGFATRVPPSALLSQGNKVYVEINGKTRNYLEFSIEQ